MDIKFSCTKCGQHIAVDESGAGLSSQCPNCNAAIVVPTKSPNQPGANLVIPPPLPVLTAKTSGLAIVSLILGILGITCILPIVGSLAALILGIIALIKISKSGGLIKGLGLAIAGTILGGVGLVMGPLIVAMLVPAIVKARTKAYQVQVMSEERLIENAVHGYFADRGKLPDNTVNADRVYNVKDGNADLIYTLTSSNAGANANHLLNPRQIIYLELPKRENARNSSGSFCDPWGNPYYVILDTDYNNTVSNFHGKCLVISGGPDGDITKTNDNIINLAQ